MTDGEMVAAAPRSVSELLARLDGAQGTLPRRLAQCAVFTRRHLHLIAVSTVAELSAASGVAPSVYIRFCKALGFSGYSEMQALFRARWTEFRPNYEERLATLREEGGGSTGRLLAEFAEAGHKSLLSLANTVTSDRLEGIARGMAKARVVHLVGLRRAFAVVSSMSYLLGKMEVAATLHSGAGMLDSAASIFPDDVLFAVTFAPFSEETIDFARTVAARGVTVYGLSDTSQGPLAGIASEMLIAREDEVAGFRALNAAITLTTTLAVAVGSLREKR